MAGARQTGGNAEIKTMMTDAAIKAKTGKDWAGWFAALDKAGAARLDHRGIARLAGEKMGAGDWYGQMVAVSYERAHGLRVTNQKCDGEFSVSVTRVMKAPLTRLYAVATAEPKTWFPKGDFMESSRIKDKYWRGKWKSGRLDLGFYAKGPGKAQIALQSNKLSGAAAVEKERSLWKKAIDTLQGMVEA